MKSIEYKWEAGDTITYYKTPKGWEPRVRFVDVLQMPLSLPLVTREPTSTLALKHLDKAYHQMRLSQASN